MKKIILFVLLSILLISCQSEYSEKVSEKIKTNIALIEEAFPDVPKEQITLQNGLVVEKCNNLYIFEGDIILTNEQFEKLDQSDTRSAVMTSLSSKWPGNNVYYKFDSDFAKIDNVMAAFEEYETKTSVRFFPATGNTPNYIKFINSDGNWSYMGKRPTPQAIGLSPYSTVGTAIHEIGHALGLFHEHTRTDRDNYININYDNIQPDKRHNFYKYVDIGYVGIDVGEIDFNSIMIYPSYNSFAINYFIPTITKKDGSTFNAQREYLSQGDIAGIRYRYGLKYNNIISIQIEELPTVYGPGYGDIHKYKRVFFIATKPVTSDVIFEVEIDYWDHTDDEYYGDNSLSRLDNVTIRSGNLVSDTIEFCSFCSYRVGKIFVSCSEYLGNVRLVTTEDLRCTYEY